MYFSWQFGKWRVIGDLRGGAMIQEELETQILPMVYLALESNMSQVQVNMSD